MSECMKGGDQQVTPLVLLISRGVCGGSGFPVRLVSDETCYVDNAATMQH